MVALQVKDLMLLASILVVCATLSRSLVVLRKIQNIVHLRIQQWNKPQPRKLPSLPVVQLTSRREVILQKEREEELTVKTFDPRPLYQRHLHVGAIETSCCDLLSLNKPTAFLDILVPSLDKNRHDHSYTQSSRDQVYMSNTAEDEESTTEESKVIFTFDFLSVVRCAIILIFLLKKDRKLRY